jgi:hypothetical protein
MRRTLLILALGVAVMCPPFALAKFGISKTRVKLNRFRPPDVLLLGETATVEVTTRSRRITDRQLDAVRSRLEDALKTRELRLVGSGADNVVRVALDDLEARVDQRIVYETKYVKIGERQEYNAKKNKYETKDVYGNREEPVQVTTVRGNLSARVEATTPAGERSASARADYSQEFKGSARIPVEASSEDALERYLVEAVADRAAATVVTTPDPVEALLAVDGDLKNGNRLAEAGLFQEALAEWNRKVLKGDKEAARQHNLGVAHEALAYKLIPESPEHLAALQLAAESYKKALALDPGEKYFSEPNDRVQESIGYATTATRQVGERQRYQEQRAARKAAPPPAPVSAPAATPARADAPPRKPAARPAAAPPAAAPPRPVAVPPPVAAPPVTAKPPFGGGVTGVGGSASLAGPLRNGSFEGSVAPWTLAGNATLIDQPGRGKVLQAGAAGSVAVTQSVSVDVTKAAEAMLSLQYKVASGEASVGVVVGYDDAQGRARTATLEVTGGDAPGSWTDWSADVAAVRPKPARVKEVRLLVDGGTVLLDNVALTLR